MDNLIVSSGSSHWRGEIRCQIPFPKTLLRLSSPPWLLALGYSLFQCINVFECCCGSLMPNVMVFGGEAFGRRLCHKERTLMNGINSGIEEASERPWPLPPCELKAPSMNQKVPSYWKLQKKPWLNGDYIIFMDWKIQYHREEPRQFWRTTGGLTLPDVQSCHKSVGTKRMW